MSLSFLSFLDKQVFITLSLINQTKHRQSLITSVQCMFYQSNLVPFRSSHNPSGPLPNSQLFPKTLHAGTQTTSFKFSQSAPLQSVCDTQWPLKESVGLGKIYNHLVISSSFDSLQIIFPLQQQRPDFPQYQLHIGPNLIIKDKIVSCRSATHPLVQLLHAILCVT
jgi:hypothetical protein